MHHQVQEVNLIMTMIQVQVIITIIMVLRLLINRGLRRVKLGKRIEVAVKINLVIILLVKWVMAKRRNLRSSKLVNKLSRRRNQNLKTKLIDKNKRHLKRYKK